MINFKFHKKNGDRTYYKFTYVADVFVKLGVSLGISYQHNGKSLVVQTIKYVHVADGKLTIVGIAMHDSTKGEIKSYESQGRSKKNRRN